MNLITDIPNTHEQLPKNLTCVMRKCVVKEEPVWICTLEVPGSFHIATFIPRVFPIPLPVEAVWELFKQFGNRALSLPFSK